MCRMSYRNKRATLKLFGRLLLANQTPAAAIAGKVADNPNHPAVAAFVTVSAEPTSPSKPALNCSLSARAAANGAFSVGNLFFPNRQYPTEAQDENARDALPGAMEDVNGRRNAGGLPPLHAVWGDTA